MQCWIEIDGVVLRYVFDAAAGDDRPVVVLLHEMGGSLENWDRVVPGLVAAGHRVLRHDIRGSGMSEKIIGDIAIGRLAADTLALVEALAIPGPVVVAGCAMGATIALACALAAPDRVRGVVAMAPATGSGGQRGTIDDIARQVRDTGLRGRLLPQVDRYFLPRFRTDEAAYRSYRCRVATGDGESYLAHSRMLAALDLRPQLSRIACPVLVLAGTVDRIRPPAAVAEIAALIPDARFEEVDSGHFMPVLTPAIVADRIDAFTHSLT